MTSWADVLTEAQVRSAINLNTGPTDPVGTLKNLDGAGTDFPALIGLVRTAGLDASVTLTDADPIVVDATRGTIFTVTLGGNRTLANPTGATDGQRLLFRIKQPASGGPYTVTLDTNYRFGDEITDLVLSTAASATDYVGAIYDAAADKFDIIAVAKGY